MLRKRGYLNEVNKYVWVERETEKGTRYTLKFEGTRVDLKYWDEKKQWRAQINSTGTTLLAFNPLISSSDIDKAKRWVEGELETELGPKKSRRQSR